MDGKLTELVIQCGALGILAWWSGWFAGWYWPGVRKDRKEDLDRAAAVEKTRLEHGAAQQAAYLKSIESMHAAHLAAVERLEVWGRADADECRKERERSQKTNAETLGRMADKFQAAIVEVHSRVNPSAPTR